MEVKVVAGDIARFPAGAVIVNLFEGVEAPGGATAAVDRALDGLITQLIADKEIKGKASETTLLHTMGKMEAARVIVVGLGKEGELTLARLSAATAEACRAARKSGAEVIATVAHGAGAGGIDAEQATQAAAEGAILGLYTFRRHRARDPEQHEVAEVLIVERDEERLPAMERGLARGRALAEATNLARDMANEPANFMTPRDMADVARSVAAECGLECRVLGPDEIEGLGMGALLGVAQGSRQPPQLICVSYRGDEASGQTVGLVGKGVTFDSGGISIKPSEGMGDMKGDMSGGAAVIAAMRTIGTLKPRLNVTALVPATENLPDGAALKPGDILTAHSGKTIEIINTDAEGRLILADALSYAQTLGLAPVIDIATLTGACHIALGEHCSGAFGNDQGLIARAIAAGEEAGERIWQMPMFDEYKEQNKSDVADIKNSAGRWGGAITAAQFLAEFVGERPWVHLDIAGTARSEKERGILVKGATGVGVRTLANLVLALGAEGP